LLILTDSACWPAQPGPLFDSNIPSIPRYIYTPLKGNQSIRLINLLAGNHDEPLLCTLREIDLGDPCEYEAISYIRGNATTEISVTSETGMRSIEIPHNLEAALLRYRLQDKPRLLWADSICIDQEDLDERSQQVKIMGQIYQKAACVQIWLGEEDEETELAYKCIRIVVERVFEKIIENGRKRNITPDLSNLNEDQATECIRSFYNIPGSDSPEFRVLRHLFLSPWFYRAWIF